MWIYIIGILIVVAIIVVIVLCSIRSTYTCGNGGKGGKGSNKNKSDENKKKNDNVTCEPNYLRPKPFFVGVDPTIPQKRANNCSTNPAIVYPIKQPYVKYDLDNIPSDCRCLEFIQPP